ncbi:hypothetical protein BJY04DRAFT_225757 [Aspergillus karnatakaensis]|uniref:GMC family oxidoreductase n=1 Tax=Aspergillus karnatakaensis TaxID=1810916 RepID=UPI003CCE4213
MMALASCLFLVLLVASRATSQIFDYIVVGGGTSGLPLAVRLAEAEYRVALIEAGTRYEAVYPLAKTPGAAGIPIGSKPGTHFPAEWGFVTEPLAGLNGRRVHLTRGKCLGGTPSRQSLDLWAEAVNDSSYAFDNIFPFYQRSVEFTPPNMEERAPNATVEFNASAFDVAGGPLQVSYANYAQTFSSWMERGMDDIGLPESTDFNSGEINGYQYCSSTIRPDNQHRSSSAASFLDKPYPPSLTVYQATLARRVIFDRHNYATGVEIETPEVTQTRVLEVTREVIVSAGAFQSPQLLMVSGVGPRQQLSQFGIPVISELPGTFTRIATDPVYLASQYARWAKQAEGPLTNPLGDFLGWEKVPDDLRAEFSSETQQNLSAFPADWPEIEYIAAGLHYGNVSNIILDQPRDGYQYASIMGVVIASTSRGSITLASPEMWDPPVIDLGLLTTQSDQEVAVAIFKRIRQTFASRGMNPVVIGPEFFPGEQVQTNEQILEYIRENAMSLWHPSCTCKMGTADDPMAVVDSQARVFGVRGLRVVDASSFPFLPPGHPHSSCYMLAEKIANDILNPPVAEREGMVRMDLRR